MMRPLAVSMAAGAFMLAATATEPVDWVDPTIGATSHLLVLDEPVAGLDPHATSEMYGLVRQINREDGVTVMMVSHDVCCAVAEATHVLHLGHHARFCGPVEAYRTSELGRSFLAAAGVIHDEEYHVCDCAQCRPAREVAR